MINHAKANSHPPPVHNSVLIFRGGYDGLKDQGTRAHVEKQTRHERRGTLGSPLTGRVVEGSFAIVLVKL
jgi:hypothetical protein